MKQTLLELTQDILSNLSSDEVNSISDSAESLQVATIIKQKYFDIISRSDLTKQYQLFQLDPSLDPASPVLMYVPEGIGKLEYIKYFNSNVSESIISIDEDNLANDIQGTEVPQIPSPPGYQFVTMLPIAQFLDKIGHFNPSEFNVESFIFSDTSNSFPGNYTFYYKNDTQPSYCCVLSNYYIIFDSFDQTQDSTLQASKTMCYGQVIPTWKMEDNFTPNLDDKQFPLLINEAKSLAFFELKQTGHAKAEQESKRQWSSLQRTKHVTDVPSDFNQLPNFGRKGPGGPGRTLINWGGNSYSWL